MPTAPRLTSIYFALQDNSGRAHPFMVGPLSLGPRNYRHEESWHQHHHLHSSCHLQSRATDMPGRHARPLSGMRAAAYNTSIPALANVSSNFLENGMAAAARGNMSALIAPYLGTNLNPRSPASLNAGATATITIIRDLNKTFGAAPKGYYIAQECGNDDPGFGTRSRARPPARIGPICSGAASQTTSRRSRQHSR